ncbi:hypothetical protein ACMFMG_001251 [Clarireedia jacksonii]
MEQKYAVMLMVGRSVYRERSDDSPKKSDPNARITVLLEICCSETPPIPQNKRVGDDARFCAWRGGACYTAKANAYNQLTALEHASKITHIEGKAYCQTRDR